jgi:hypothetical protein
MRDRRNRGERYETAGFVSPGAIKHRRGVALWIHKIEMKQDSIIEMVKSTSQMNSTQTIQSRKAPAHHNHIPATDAQSDPDSSGALLSPKN